jgi:hypothetical protein
LGAGLLGERIRYVMYDPVDHGWGHDGVAEDVHHKANGRFEVRIRQECS